MNKNVILICEDCLSRNYNYKRNNLVSNRLILNKFCQNCNKKTVHKESK